MQDSGMNWNNVAQASPRLDTVNGYFDFLPGADVFLAAEMQPISMVTSTLMPVKDVLLEDVLGGFHKPEVSPLPALDFIIGAAADADADAGYVSSAYADTDSDHGMAVPATPPHSITVEEAVAPAHLFALPSAPVPQPPVPVITVIPAPSDDAAVDDDGAAPGSEEEDQAPARDTSMQEGSGSDDGSGGDDGSNNSNTSRDGSNQTSDKDSDNADDGATYSANDADADAADADDAFASDCDDLDNDPDYEGATMPRTRARTRKRKRRQTFGGRARPSKRARTLVGPHGVALCHDHSVPEDEQACEETRRVYANALPTPMRPNLHTQRTVICSDLTGTIKEMQQVMAPDGIVFGRTRVRGRVYARGKRWAFVMYVRTADVNDVIGDGSVRPMCAARHDGSGSTDDGQLGRIFTAYHWTRSTARVPGHDDLTKLTLTVEMDFGSLYTGDLAFKQRWSLSKKAWIWFSFGNNKYATPVIFISTSRSDEVSNRRHQASYGMLFPLNQRAATPVRRSPNRSPSRSR